MIPFHPDLITTVHDDRMERRRGARAMTPRRGEDVRWVRRARRGGSSERAD
jgi:hypothetical protein